MFNEESTIARLLLSLSRLDYPRRDLEVVIVDGGSQDSTREIVNRFPFELLVEPKKITDASARNLGINRSKGDILAFTDADCVVSRSWLRDLVRGFDHAKIGGVAGPIVPLETGNLVQKFQAWLPAPNHDADRRPYPYAVTANVAYRSEVFRKVGMFDERYPAGSDMDLSLRMQKLSDYSLRFLTGSGVVFHGNERNFLRLMSRARTYGYGYYFLSRKHPSELPQIDDRFRDDALVVPLVARLVIGIAKGTPSAERLGDFFSIVLFEAMRAFWQISFDYGVTTGKTKKQQPDSSADAEFESTSG